MVVLEKQHNYQLMLEKVRLHFFYRVSRKTPKTSSCVETFFVRPVKKLGQHFFSVYFLTLCFHGWKEKNWIPQKAKALFLHCVKDWQNVDPETLSQAAAPPFLLPPSFSTQKAETISKKNAGINIFFFF